MINFLKRFFILLIGFYKKYISPLFPACCRFTPTCSEYAIESIEKYGICKGCFLTIKRILKCHPYSKGGYDPVP